MWEQAQQALLESATRLVTGIARLLPGMVALLVAVCLSALVAWALGVVLRRSLRGLEFDAALERWGWSGLADLSPGKSPTRLVVRVTRLGVMVLGALVGLTALDASLTTQLVMPVLGYLPNLLAAMIVVAVGVAVARFLGRGVLIAAVNSNLPYSRLLGVGVRWLVSVLTAAMALKHLGVGGSLVDLAFGILFGGIVLALALAVGLGSRDLVTRTLERQKEQAARDSTDSLSHF